MPSFSLPQPLLTALRGALAAAGFDICTALNGADYDVTVPREHRLPRTKTPQPLVILVGNTRALWPRFIAFLRQTPQWLEAPDPFDRFVEMEVERLVEMEVERQVDREIRPVLDAKRLTPIAAWAHGPPPVLSMQKLAVAAGIAHLGPSQLCIHPVYGPWFALRAALVFEVPGVTSRSVCPDPCGPECSERCGNTFDAALQSGRQEDWIALRQQCVVGASFRYSDEQIAYHYYKDTKLLARAIAAPVTS